MTIVVSEEERRESKTLEELKEEAPDHVELAERVPGKEGRGFDLTAWYQAWTSRSDGQELPTHLEVEAADEFRAVIPWRELGSAVLVYEQNGEPLRRGGPLRLYVPEGSSDCLHVKSVVKLSFLHTQKEAKDKARFGFANRVSPESMLKR
ncbi:molybdopterin-dependent oxidoreductase [Paenibacillus aurantius]|uniref:Molybdopterin-dependent oxidoreductase n=1 Tax=Paenibacillus aurantius TaxID=2918900 RepID=A0AA96RE07_9BACL|nr:molybdopterin-dependent oxidoreductase [Paenibacillus aurantius]WNQ09986.1 molybdopterin-dependent oxidoreductase [Paenibacillus aurantius]